MSKISGGVRIGGFVSPSDSLDTYPTHKSEYGFGGHREVIDLTSRDAITNDRRSEGMTVWVISENKEYRLIGGIANSNWQEVTTGSGSSDPVEWANVQNKPTSFTPSSHSHTSTEISDAAVNLHVSWMNIDNKPANYTPASHAHILADISDLTDLEIEWTKVKSKPTSFTPSTHSHTVADISDISTNFPIDWANVQNKPTSFTPSTHSHSASEVTDFASAIAADTNIADLILKKHSHTNISALNKLTESNGKPIWDGSNFPSDIGIVTYANLATNNSVGMETNKVAPGDHTHPYLALTSGAMQEMTGDLKINGNLIVTGTSSIPGGSGSDSELQQIDITAPAGTSTSTPYSIDIPITYTSDFKRREPSVLKFVPGTQNVVRSACNFDLADNTKFVVTEDGADVPGHQSKYVIWDGTMRLKTGYQTPMNYDGVLEDGNLFSLNLTLSEEGVVSPEDFIGFINPTESREYKFKKILNLVN